MPSEKAWEKKGRAAGRRNVGRGPGAPEEDACLVDNVSSFARRVAEDDVKRYRVPASMRPAFERGYAQGVEDWARQLRKRKWCKTFRADEGL